MLLLQTRHRLLSASFPFQLSTGSTDTWRRGKGEARMGMIVFNILFLPIIILQ